MHSETSDREIRIDKPQQKECVLSIDFTQAFDLVDWKYIIQLLRKNEFSLLQVDILENLYGKTKTLVDVNGFLREEISLVCCIRQGCPLLALEPLLEILIGHQWFGHPVKH